MDQREEIGKEILQAIWYNVALRILALSKEVYHLDESQFAALKDVFGRPNDYTVEIRTD